MSVWLLILVAHIEIKIGSIKIRSLIIEITKVISCSEEFEVRTWDVETQQGPRKFQTKRDAWPRILPEGKLLIKDVAGDLYCIHAPHRMDAHSRKQLASFIDWCGGLNPQVKRGKILYFGCKAGGFNFQEGIKKNNPPHKGAGWLWGTVWEDGRLVLFMLA